MRHRGWLGLIIICLLLVAAGPAHAGLTDWLQGPPPDEAGRRQRIAELYAQYRRDFPQAPEIGAAQALAMWREGKPITFVDAREPAERAVSILAGAITARELQADPAAQRGRAVIIYCTIGYRSGVLTAELARRDIPALNLAGGILAWLHAGGPVFHDGQEVKRVHVYGRRWDLAPLAYQAVY